MTIYRLYTYSLPTPCYPPSYSLIDLLILNVLPIAQMSYRVIITMFSIDFNVLLVAQMSDRVMLTMFSPSSLIIPKKFSLVQLLKTEKTRS